MNETDFRQLTGIPLTLARIGYILLVVILVALLVLGMAPYLAEQASGYIDVSLDRNAAGEIVLTPIANGGADQAGIQAGDILLAVDGTPLPADATPDQASKLVTGKLGTPVTITVRAADGSEKAVSIVRSERYVQALASVGLSNDTVTAVHTALELILTIITLALSLEIFIKHSSDWLVILAAGILAVLPSGMGVVNIPLSGAYAFHLYPLYALLRAAALLLGLLFLLVFPNGKFFRPWTKGVAIGAAVYALLYWVYMAFITYRVPFQIETYLWLIFFLVGVYVQVRRYIQESTPEEKKRTLWLIYGAAAVIVGYVLVLIYNGLAGNSLSLGQRIVGSMARNAFMYGVLIFFAFSLRKSLRKVE